MTVLIKINLWIALLIAVSESLWAQESSPLELDYLVEARGIQNSLEALLNKPAPEQPIESTQPRVVLDLRAFHYPWIGFTAGLITGGLLNEADIWTHDWFIFSAIAGTVTGLVSQAVVEKNTLTDFLHR